MSADAAEAADFLERASGVARLAMAMGKKCEAVYSRFPYPLPNDHHGLIVSLENVQEALKQVSADLKPPPAGTEHVANELIKIAGISRDWKRQFDDGRGEWPDASFFLPGDYKIFVASGVSIRVAIEAARSAIGVDEQSP